MNYQLVLGAATVLPATAAVSYIPALQSTQTAVTVIVFAAVWAGSYLGIERLANIIKK